MVLTEDGEKPIEDIEVGDEVWAYNTETGEDELKHVTAVKVSETDEIVHVITSDGEDIRTTRLHPFYVVNESHGTWISAGELHAGDVLKTQDGRSVTVEEVRVEKLTENVKVYNLEIEDLHTYYVNGRVLVHNTCNDADNNDVNSEESAFDKWLNKGNNDNKVYFGVDFDERYTYTGITKQAILDRLKQHNKNGKGFIDLVVKASDLTRNQARAIEQYFIENGPNEKNLINSISVTNKYYKLAKEWAEAYIKENNIG